MEEKAPALAKATRTRVYVACLAVNVATLVGFGLSAVFGALDTKTAIAAGGVIIGGVGLVSNALAVGYRPTKLGADDLAG